MSDRKNIFVLGMNDANRRRLAGLPQAETVEFHTLLAYEESHGAREYRIDDIHERARRRLHEFDGTIDGIIGFWDFPVSTMLPMLCDEFGLVGPTLESVLRCEHKSWSRQIQQETVPEVTPRFVAFDPYDDDAVANIDLPYPYWLKPVKSFASHLGFRIDDRDELARVLPIIREHLPHFSAPFQWVLDRADLPPDIAAAGARLCIAEEIIAGWQCTVEGVVLDGEIHLHGVIDSHHVPGMSVFDRYEYPSELPEPVQDRMFDASRRLLERIGYDNRAFNIEYFWDRENDTIRLLEINPRISQSHSFLFQQVDGVSNHAVVVDAALGEEYAFPHREGPFGVAGKFFIRMYESDGLVGRVPHADDIARLREVAPEADLEVAAAEGKLLSDIPYQDSYSYKLAVMYLAADSRETLHRERERVMAVLPFEVDEDS